MPNSTVILEVYQGVSCCDSSGTFGDGGIGLVYMVGNVLQHIGMEWPLDFLIIVRINTTLQLQLKP